MPITGPSYRVAGPTLVCAATGRALAPGERYVATLVERPGSADLERMDFSIGAWDAGARPESPLALFGSWTGRAPDGTRPARTLLDDDELLDLFEQLEAADEPGRLAFRFVLALALVRRRLLSYEGGTPAGRAAGSGGTMTVRRRGLAEGRAFEVVDPGMDDEAVAAAVEQIGLIMNPDAGPRPGKGS